MRLEHCRHCSNLLHKQPTDSSSQLEPILASDPPPHNVIIGPHFSSTIQRGWSPRKCKKWFGVFSNKILHSILFKKWLLEFAPSFRRGDKRCPLLSACNFPHISWIHCALFGHWEVDMSFICKFDCWRMYSWGIFHWKILLQCAFSTYSWRWSCFQSFTSEEDCHELTW